MYVLEIQMRSRITYVNPIDMTLQLVHGVSNQFHITLDEMRLVNGQTTQFSRANGRKVAGMREEHTPTAQRVRTGGGGNGGD